MNSKEKHRKHGNISRPEWGRFGRKETAILGTTCEEIQFFVNNLRWLFPEKDIAYVDEDHNWDDEVFGGTHLQFGDSNVKFFEKNSDNPFNTKIRLAASDMVLVNGNHFEAQSQMIICNPDKEKSLQKRVSQLTNVRAFILRKNQTQLPEYITRIVPEFKNIPVISLADTGALKNFFYKEWMHPASVKALILTGGKSARMGTDKAQLKHHGTKQFRHLKNLLDKMNIENYISCRPEQAQAYLDEGCEVIEDSVKDLGPMGGIISAFMKFPDAAWMVLACDIPLLDETVIRELIDSRDPAKCATSFKSDFNGFPEPLIAIWEPKSYIRLMEFLALGYDCPRKVLINSDTKIVVSAHPEKLANVNTPEDLASLREVEPGEGR